MFAKLLYRQDIVATDPYPCPASLPPSSPSLRSVPAAVAVVGRRSARLLLLRLMRTPAPEKNPGPPQTLQLLQPRSEPHLQKQPLLPSQLSHLSQRQLRSLSLRQLLHLHQQLQQHSLGYLPLFPLLGLRRRPPRPRLPRPRPKRWRCTLARPASSSAAWSGASRRGGRRRRSR